MSLSPVELPPGVCQVSEVTAELVDRLVCPSPVTASEPVLVWLLNADQWLSLSARCGSPWLGLRPCAPPAHYPCLVVLHGTPGSLLVACVPQGTLDALARLQPLRLLPSSRAPGTSPRVRHPTPGATARGAADPGVPAAPGAVSQDAGSPARPPRALRLVDPEAPHPVVGPESSFEPTPVAATPDLARGGARPGAGPSPAPSAATWSHADPLLRTLHASPTLGEAVRAVRASRGQSRGARRAVRRLSRGLGVPEHRVHLRLDQLLTHYARLPGGDADLLVAGYGELLSYLALGQLPTWLANPHGLSLGDLETIAEHLDSPNAARRCQGLLLVEQWRLWDGFDLNRSRRLDELLHSGHPVLVETARRILAMPPPDAAGGELGAD